ncbi:hypothetical protein [uncultured Christiangramia sp.]|uniref:hypothetical protein n=1 Tax=uncultured Christiangramia sp. TaxID=503836 RepID=UPI0025EC6230|nr:hypothetical protein [uncultured Christiangramia sp.]|tara:strand:+ start:2963 stop:3628 length:666 start_codon:yes stop_codon:yes gene_type:complete
MFAVITADLLNSTKYSAELLTEVLDIINAEIEGIEMKYKNSKFELYRGDSIQGVLEPVFSFRSALRIKTAVNKLRSQEAIHSNSYRIEADLRISIGIGKIGFKRDSIMESNGEAFQFSGRTLDEMKKTGRKMTLTTGINEINNEFDNAFLLFDTITDKWSSASAEVIYYLLKEMKETEIADTLGISQSAVNQRKKAAGWDAILSLMERYEQVMKQHFIDGE